MGKIEAILSQANLLTAIERQRLAALLLQEIALTDPAEDMAVGRRGLAAWTESARTEDWAEFYPPSPRDNGASRSDER